MKEFFDFAKKDRNAILLLLLIIIVIAFYKYFSSNKPSTGSPLLIVDSTQKNIQKNYSSNNLNKAEDEKESFSNEENYLPKEAVNISIDKPFDPNQFGLQDWKNIGLPDKICNTINHYQQKNGKFRKAEDLKKIWGMKQEWFEKIEPFVQINPTEKKSFDIEKHAPIFYKKSIYEINAADSLQLDSLRLIGMKTANRIIKYRNLLGGFYSLEQLKEVWGFKDSMLIMNQSRLTVDASKIKKININQASVEILKMHPYIHYQKAVVMNNFRKAHGNFKTMDDIKNTKVFTDAELEKLSPYISF